MEGILERLRREVKQRRLLLYPYFRDYDRVSGEKAKYDSCLTGKIRVSGRKTVDYHKVVHPCIVQ